MNLFDGFFWFECEAQAAITQSSVQLCDPQGYELCWSLEGNNTFPTDLNLAVAWKTDFLSPLLWAIPEKHIRAIERLALISSNSRQWPVFSEIPLTSRNCARTRAAPVRDQRNKKPTLQTRLCGECKENGPFWRSWAATVLFIQSTLKQSGKPQSLETSPGRIRQPLSEDISWTFSPPAFQDSGRHTGVFTAVFIAFANCKASAIRFRPRNTSAAQSLRPEFIRFLNLRQCLAEIINMSRHSTGDQFFSATHYGIPLRRTVIAMKATDSVCSHLGDHRDHKFGMDQCPR